MNKTLYFTSILGILACLMTATELYSQTTKWSPEQVYYGSGGKLAYTPDEQGNIIPDFSNVGYMYGDAEIPDVPTVIEVSPVDGDDGATIQQAIDQVSMMSLDQNGFRGAVLLKKGTYQVAGKLYIRRSGIVLRGEGQSEDGTVISAEGNVKRDFIVVGNGSGLNVSQVSKVNIVEGYVPVGRKFVVVADASKFMEGERISVYRPGTANWISDLKMDQIANDDGQTKQWDPDSYCFHFERLVTKVSGDTIFFRNPVVMAMETKYGGGSVYKCTSDRIENVGIEDLLLKSAYQSETDEDHAWVAVAFGSVENGWARRLTSKYFGYACVSVNDNARLITVESCNCRDPKSELSGGRRYSFNLGGGSLTLFKNCTTTEGRHDFVSGSRVKGPNVFVNCTASNVHADSGPHHRWAMGTLYDNIVTDGAINVQDRGQSGSGHGWAGANQVFWSCKGASSISQSPWVSAKNYNFGFIGDKASGALPGRPDGEWVGQNKPGIFPESLYLAQLDSRLNNVQVFSVYPALERVNDTAYILSFNLPFFNTLAKAQNFSVTGNAGYEGTEFSVTVQSDTSIMFVFDGIGPLPPFSSITVNVLNMLSSTGKPLTGLTSATYIEPDLRPVVTGITARVNNEDGFLEASSSKPGYIYIIKYVADYSFAELYQTVADLDEAVANNLGRKVDAPYADSTVMISTKGLPGAYYVYFAVDEDGRLSKPGIEWPEVIATGPLLGLDKNSIAQGFSVWASNGAIYIRPGDTLTNYSVQIFDMTGRLFMFRENMTGDQQLPGPDYWGILIVKLISKNGSGTGVSKLWYNPL
ncbi:MAG TPA: hypothetical protein VE870_12375 [Bacteroidales bacterium]|nr:hypothetical protein [Bacteroidales bacterium]